MTEAGPLTAAAWHDDLATEYYDAGRHPTCANFRQASRALIEGMLSAAKGDYRCEVGAGDSIMADFAVRRRGNASGLLVTDASPAMLEYSRRWQEHGATLSVARASDLPVPERSLDLVVASLGDPYDDDAFWQEVARVLSPTGHCLLTTPSWEWAERFRTNGDCTGLAEFELADGRLVAVPSTIRKPIDQRALIERHGLRVVEEAEVQLEAIEGPLSDKLHGLDDSDPVVVSYLAAIRR